MLILPSMYQSGLPKSAGLVFKENCTVNLPDEHWLSSRMRLQRQRTLDVQGGLVHSSQQITASGIKSGVAGILTYLICIFVMGKRPSAR